MLPGKGIEWAFVNNNKKQKITDKNLNPFAVPGAAWDNTNSRPGCSCRLLMVLITPIKVSLGMDPHNSCSEELMRSTIFNCLDWEDTKNEEFMIPPTTLTVFSSASWRLSMLWVYATSRIICDKMAQASAWFFFYIHANNNFSGIVPQFKDHVPSSSIIV